jgi:hypothetical protein
MHRVAAVVGAADQPAPEELADEDRAAASRTPPAGERRLRLPVADQLERHESSPHRRTSPTIGLSSRDSSIRAEGALVAAHRGVEPLPLEQVEVGERGTAERRPGPAEGEPLGEGAVAVPANGAKTRSEAITAPIGAYAEVRPIAVVMMSARKP